MYIVTYGVVVRVQGVPSGSMFTATGLVKVQFSSQKITQSQHGRRQTQLKLNCTELLALHIDHIYRKSSRDGLPSTSTNEQCGQVQI